ncbi:AMP-binding protein [Acidaminococcus massiliensis]|uniref:AMP-binding protein n=1 Tax=Acidaminococcus massiliensis TaxID=1852375 RepID=UPI000A4476AF|nr:AMP-binding protein [Acidaminococcus massiliensis]
MLVHELLSFGNPDRLAVCDQGRSYTYRELRDLVRRCRNALYVQGVRQQTPVALFSRKTVHYIVAYLAIASLGAIAVPVNSQLSQREVGYILRDSGTRLLSC